MFVITEFVITEFHCFMKFKLFYGKDTKVEISKFEKNLKLFSGYLLFLWSRFKLIYI